MPPSPEENSAQTKEQEKDGEWVNAQLLEEVLGQDAKVLNVDVERATGKGDNYLSIIYRTRVTYRSPDIDDAQVKHLMIKGLPAGEFLQKYIKEMEVFEREITVYDKLKDLYNFADARLDGKSFKRFSVTSFKTSRPDTLILDDLKPQGFVMASRKERLDFTHAKLVVSNLARLHALSVAYTEHHPDFLSQFADKVYAENNKERLSQFFAPIFNFISGVVKKWEGFGEIADKLHGKGDIFVDKLIDICNSESSFRNVLIHGDCWINNILFKYTENGEPIDLRFVDFQITRKSSPAIDLHYFLSSSLQNLVRQNHWDDLLRIYCDVFERTATQLGYGGPTITFEDISKEMHRIVFFRFCCVVSIAAVVRSDPDDSPDLGSITEDQMQEGDIQEFHKIYSSSTFREDFQDQLPYFDKLGLFD